MTVRQSAGSSATDLMRMILLRTAISWNQSPGLDRPLKKEKDFVRSMGKAVELCTYRPIEKQKEFSGILTAYDDNSVTIEEDGALRTFDKKEIALDPFENRILTV